MLRSLTCYMRPDCWMGMVRSSTWLGLACTMLLPTEGHANHDSVPDPAPQQTSQRLPTLPYMDRTAVTVSGLSSGGFFAHQFHVAFSSLVKGAGVLAGGPYGCVEAIPNPWLPFWSVSLDRFLRQWWPARTTMATVTMVCAPRHRRPRIQSGSSESTRARA